MSGGRRSAQTRKSIFGGLGIKVPFLTNFSDFWLIFLARTFFHKSTLGGAQISKKSKIGKNRFFVFQTNRETEIRSSGVDLATHEQKQELA